MANRAPVIIVYGNHDLPGDLEVFSRLKAAWPITVVHSPRVLTIPLATGSTAAMLVLPYPTRAGLVAAGAGSDAIQAQAYAALETIFMEAREHLEEAVAAGAIPLMIGHINVGGAMTSVGQPNIGREIELDQVLLSRLGNGYKGLNHIHKAQMVGDAWYAGSLCRLDWGEIEDKRYLEVTYARVGDHWGGYAGDGPCDRAGDWDYDVRSCRIAVAPMWHVEGELTRDGFTWQTAAGLDGRRPDPPSQWTGCEVRARYRYQASERSVLTDALVRAAFAEAMHLVLDPIAISNRALRAPEVAAARTLAEKVRAWAEQSGYLVSVSLLAKLALLEHSEPPEVLTSVARALEEPSDPIVKEML